MQNNVNIVGQIAAVCDQCLPKTESFRHAENRTHRIHIEKRLFDRDYEEIPPNYT